MGTTTIYKDNGKIFDDMNRAPGAIVTPGIDMECVMVGQLR